MHYGRIYIQYFALWRSHWPGGLIVCVLQQCSERPPPPLTVNASAQWDHNVKGCQLKKGLFFLQPTADLIRDQCIDDLLKDFFPIASGGRRSFRSRHVLCGAPFSFQEKMSFI